MDLPVLVLSMHDESLYAGAGSPGRGEGIHHEEMEASGRVMMAIRKVMGGEIYLSEGTTSRILKNITDGKSSVNAPALSNLTDRELEVFQLIGKGKTTREIAETLNLGLTTIDTYRARIKEKLNLRNATELIHQATDWVLYGQA